MIFEYSDALLLQAIRLSEQDEEGVTLIDIIKISDFINHALLTYSEFETGMKKLKNCSVITEKEKRLVTTVKLRAWWTKKFEGNGKIGVHKGTDEILKYLNRTYKTSDEQSAEIKISKQDFDKSTQLYFKWVEDIAKQIYR